ncbi:A-kinase anchor protein 5 isoform X2 [Alexandromys fortis]|uniref:A-kinase anchor protein 5 isoform X2 n=1 Tax=Alexandromys fortis TaxID=100897 RepID=UPI002152F52C|nr:A-kinase anchor protein 5 isoform X2 [Microtus fortis]
MKESSVKMESGASEIQIETKDEKDPGAVCPQKERQERNRATLCFKRRKKASKMKSKVASKTAEETKTRPPEAGASDQPQPAGAWASIKRLVTPRKRSASSKTQKPSAAEVQSEDAALPKKKAKSRLKIPCIRFSRGAKRSRHSKLTEDSDYNMGVQQRGAEDLEIKPQTQPADLTSQAKSTQGPVLVEEGKDVQEPQVSNVTSGENVISVELELKDESSAIQTGTPVLGKEAEVIKEKPSVQAQQASPLENSEADSPCPVASRVPASPATAYQHSVDKPSDSIRDRAPSAKDDRSREGAAEEKKASDIVQGQVEETPLSQAEEAAVSQADKSAVGQAKKAVVAQEKEVVVAQEKEAVVAQTEEAFMAKAEETVVAQVEEAVVIKAEKAVVAKAQEAVVAKAEEGVVAKAEEGIVAKAQEAVVAKAQEAVMAKAEEAVMAQAKEAVVAHTKEAVMAHAKEAVVAQAEEAVMAQAEETVVALVEETVVVQAEKALVAQAKEALVAQAEKALVAQTEEALVAQTEDALVAQAEETVVAQAEETVVAQAEEAFVAQADETVVAQAEEAVMAQAPDLKENGIDTEKPRSEECKRMEPIAIIITDTEISEFDVKKSKNVPKQFLMSMENEQVGVFANDSDFEGRTSEQYETLLIETASSLVKNAIQLSVEQLVNEMVSEDNKINTLLQ